MLKKQILFFFVFVFYGIPIFSMGAVWVLELEYRENGGRLQTGYIDGSFHTGDFGPMADNPSHLLNELMTRYGKDDSLQIFTQIIDNEKLAEVASFPMHSFKLVESSRVVYSVNSLADLSLKKIWSKDEYWIEVLTRLELKDSIWIRNKGIVDFPLGQEVGCRIEVHNLGEREIEERLLTEFIKLYKMDTPRSHQNQGRYHTILAELKENKIVLVELCGC